MIRFSRRLVLKGLGASLLLALPPQRAQAELRPRRKPRAPRRLILDPGHGGKDPGAIGRQGTEEKAIVLDIARKLAAALAGSEHVECSLTRQTDIFLPLAERVQIAQARKADLFISVHADSAPNPAARGLSAYSLAREASDAFAKAIADQENLADRAGGIPLPDEDPELAAILWDLALRHTQNAALKAKAALVRGAGRSLRLLDNPMRSANFAVLRAPDVPSLLVETGFLSNAKDEAQLRDAAYRQKLADVLARELGRILDTPPFV